jgi:hypothetical protein
MKTVKVELKCIPEKRCVIQAYVEQFEGVLPNNWPNISETLSFHVEIDEDALDAFRSVVANCHAQILNVEKIAL